MAQAQADLSKVLTASASANLLTTDWRQNYSADAVEWPTILAPNNRLTSAKR
jgi:hypothetical protein